MGLPRGHTIPLSPARRIVCDFMHAARRVPLVAMERRMPLAEVVAARAASPHRPSWFAVFLKAYAFVSEQQPALRRAYLPFPRPRLHQYECTIANLAVARRVGDDDGVLGLLIRHPQRRSLAEIDRLIRDARSKPLEKIGDFRRQLRLTRLPGPLRRLAWWLGLEVSAQWRLRYLGTFGVTSVGALGASQPKVLSPATTTLTYGPFADDGSIAVSLFYDHRVLDGVGPAAALAELETTLTGPILSELRGEMARAA